MGVAGYIQLRKCMTALQPSWLGQYPAVSGGGGGNSINIPTISPIMYLICLSVCVSLTTLEATLIYSAKNRHQWVFIYLKKLKSCESAPLIQNSCLNSLHCTVQAKAMPTKVCSTVTLVYALRVNKEGS